MLHVLLPPAPGPSLASVEAAERRTGEPAETKPGSPLHDEELKQQKVTSKVFPFWNISIYSIAPEKSKKLYCCKFIKITNKYLEPNV